MFYFELQVCWWLQDKSQVKILVESRVVPWPETSPGSSRSTLPPSARRRERGRAPKVRAPVSRPTRVPGPGGTSPVSPGLTPSPCRIWVSEDWICSNMPTLQVMAPTDVYNVRRFQLWRASRTSTASRDTHFCTTRGPTGRCSPAPSVRRSSPGRTRWSSTWSRSTTASFPSTRPRPRLPRPASLTFSWILSSARWTTRPGWTASWAVWRTPGETCSSWWVRSPVTRLTSRVRAAREPADPGRDEPGTPRFFTDDLADYSTGYWSTHTFT